MDIPVWMTQVRNHPWAALLIAGAAGIVAATLWPRRDAILRTTEKALPLDGGGFGWG